MPETPELSVVLPTYKEKENLAIFIPQIEAEFQNISLEIIVVDDNSNDGTRELVSELSKKYRNVILLERPGLLGIGSALRDGYNRARGQYILSSDADLSFVTSDMRSLYEKIRTGYDLVLGYKVVDKWPGEKRKRVITQEMMLPIGWVCNLIVRVISRTGNLREYNTNFRAIRSTMWKKFRTTEDRNFFLFETIFRAHQKGAKIAEIPAMFRPRKFGDSKLNFLQQALPYFIKLVRVIFLDKSPVA